MIPQFIYGDSYGDVANRGLAYDAARDSRYFSSLAAQRAQRQMEDQQQSGDEQLRFAYTQLGQQAANQRDSLDYQYRSMGQNADLLGQQLDSNRAIAQMQIEAQKTHNEGLVTNQLYREAYDGIRSGSIASPTELEAFAGGKLTDDQKKQLNFYIDQSARERAQLFNKSKQAADALNQEYERRLAPLAGQHAEVTKQLSTAPDSLPWYQSGRLNPLHWVAPTTKDQLYTKDLLYNTERDKFLQEVAKNKSDAQLVDTDPLTGKFVPAIPEPRFLPPGQSRTAAPGLTPGTGLAPQGTPLLTPPSPENTWKEIKVSPGHSVMIDPIIASRIIAGRSQYSVPADQDAYTQKEIANAIATGRAKQLIAGKQAAPSSKGFLWYLLAPGGAGQVGQTIGTSLK